MIFPMRGHMTLFEKIYYMPIFCAGPQDTSILWHLKKKVPQRKIFISPMITFGKCTKKINLYILLEQVNKLCPLSNQKKCGKLQKTPHLAKPPRGNPLPSSWGDSIFYFHRT